jgi:DNA (cytosine-5)-methyltransferase 1
MQHKPIALDTFCGCGGLTLGLKRAGFTVLAAVELNPAAAKIYQINHPGIPVLRTDIRSLDPAALMDQYGLKEGELSLLAGSPPCQGFSTLSTRNKIDRINDPRNDLLFEFERFIRAFRPRAVLMENVPRLANNSRFPLFCENVKALGYYTDYKILNAADYGVAQRRKRLIFLAGLEKPIPFPAPLHKRYTVRDMIGTMPPAGSSGNALHDWLSEHKPDTMAIIRSVPKDGGSRSAVPKELWAASHKKYPTYFNDTYGRMAWDDVAPTLTGSCYRTSKGRFLHPEEDREITLREASLLQGFPKGYYFPVTSKTETGLMIGNAFPPPFVTAIAKAIAKELRTA